MRPVPDDFPQTYAGKIDIYKVDVDEEEELAAAFGVSSIPSLLFCPKNGQPQMKLGAQPREALVQAIEAML